MDTYSHQPPGALLSGRPPSQLSSNSDVFNHNNLLLLTFPIVEMRSREADADWWKVSPPFDVIGEHSVDRHTQQTCATKHDIHHTCRAADRGVSHQVYGCHVVHFDLYKTTHVLCFYVLMFPYFILLCWFSVAILT